MYNCIHLTHIAECPCCKCSRSLQGLDTSQQQQPDDDATDQPDVVAQQEDTDMAEAAADHENAEDAGVVHGVGAQRSKLADSSTADKPEQQQTDEVGVDDSAVTTSATDAARDVGDASFVASMLQRASLGSQEQVCSTTTTNVPYLYPQNVP